MSWWNTPRRSGGLADSHQRHATAARKRRRFTCCRRSGSATPGAGAAIQRRPSIVTGPRRARLKGRPHAARQALAARRISFCTAPAPTNCCSRRMKPTPQRLFGVAVADALRQRCVSRICRAWQMRAPSTRRRPARKPPRAISPHCRMPAKPITLQSASGGARAAIIRSSSRLPTSTRSDAASRRGRRILRRRVARPIFLRMRS